MSYYINIPGAVLSDKNLTPYSKLLYGHISALCSVEGYCFASSDYLAEVLGVTDRAIRNYIVELLNGGHIRVEKTETKKRKIYLGTKVTVGEKPEKQIKIVDDAEQTFQAPEQTFQTYGTGIPDMRNKRSDNNTIYNTIDNNTKNKEEEVFILKPEIREDPFFPSYDSDNSKMVHKILSENAKEKYDTGIEKDLNNCNKIYSLLISDDKESELREKLIQYEFTWWAEQGKQPNAKHVVGAWSTMLASKVPKWYRDGYASHEDALKAIQRAPVTRTSAVPERFTPAESDIVNFEAEMRALKGELEVTSI
jgi:hypothetical protein